MAVGSGDASWSGVGTVPEAQGARERKSGRGGPRTASAASQRPAKTSARLRLPQPQPRSGPRPTTTPRVASPSGALPPLPPAPTRPALTQGRRSGPGLRVTYVDVLRHRGGRGRTRSANPPQRLATPLRPCWEEGAGGGKLARQPEKLIFRGPAQPRPLFGAEVGPSPHLAGFGSTCLSFHNLPSHGAGAPVPRQLLAIHFHLRGPDARFARVRPTHLRPGLGGRGGEHARALGIRLPKVRPTVAARVYGFRDPVCLERSSCDSSFAALHAPVPKAAASQLHVAGSLTHSRKARLRPETAACCCGGVRGETQHYISPCPRNHFLGKQHLGIGETDVANASERYLSLYYKLTLLYLAWYIGARALQSPILIFTNGFYIGLPLGRH
eukprot:XP_006232046.1 PREDICTED: uncharacterized protein LOC100363314 [Rattus norvegicus]